MDEYLIQGQTLTDIADAIREKTETEEQMSPQDMPQKIRSINFVLQIMSPDVLGGGKAKTKDTETIQVAVDPETGFLYVPDQSFVLEQATEVKLGGVKAKQRIDESIEVAIDPSTGKLYVPQQGGGGSYILPVATSSVLGGVKVKNKTDETVQVAADEQGFLYIKDYALKNEIPEKLPNPQPITFTGAVNETYDGSEAKTINIPTGGTGTTDYNALSNKPSIGGVTIEGNKQPKDYGIAEQWQRVEKTAGDAVFELQPNTLYVWPEMASLTVTFASPADVEITNEYHFFFTSGASPTTLSMTGVTSDAYSIEANYKYEVSVLEGIAYVKGVPTA